MSSQPVDEDLQKAEMREILTEIARTSGNAAARIAAIKELRALDADNPGGMPLSGEDKLLDELAPRRYKTKR